MKDDLELPLVSTHNSHNIPGGAEVSRVTFAPPGILPQESFFGMKYDVFLNVN
jgi:hypothetical protein